MKNPSLRVIFAGTPDFAVPTLQKIIDSSHHVLSVYTQPDRPAGRGRKLHASPVKALAEKHGLSVYQPDSFKNAQSVTELCAQQPDIMIVVAYGLILPQAVLKAPRFGCLNVHASLLPRWRGAAPIQRALQAGDKQTGITIMQMDVGLDTGDMLKTEILQVNADETGQSLHDRLAEAGAEVLMDVLEAIADGQPPAAEPQEEGLVTYASKLSKDEAEIDWQLGAVQLERQVRAFNPWPVAYTTIDGNSLRVWQANLGPQENHVEPGTVISLENNQIQVATGKGGSLVLLEVQPAGKRRMPVADFINSRRDSIQPGVRLGE